MTSSGPRRDPLIRRALALRRQDWTDLLQAVWRLALARRIHRNGTAATLLARAQKDSRLSGSDPALAGRIALAIPRAAARVPWRSDCFVQALAAQDWLARHGVGSQLFIGVRKTAGRFAAHAWLRHGDQTVTGGEFSDYQPIVTPDTPLSAAAPASAPSQPPHG